MKSRGINLGTLSFVLGSVIIIMLIRSCIIIRKLAEAKHMYNNMYTTTTAS